MEVDRRVRTVAVGLLFVCCLTATVGAGSGIVGLQTAAEPGGSSTVAAPTSGSASSVALGGPSSSAVPGGPAASPQLSDSLFEEPSDTVSEPELEVFLADPVVEPGTETTVELTILNTGQIESGTELDEETATARGVAVSVDDDDAPVSVDGGETGVGSIPPGESVSVPVSVTAPASADGQDGELDVDVEYTYTEFDSGADDETESDSFDVAIEVGSQSRFEIDDVDTDAQVGTDGTVEVELENVGEADAEAVRVSARSPTGGVTLGAANGGEVTGPATETDPNDADATEERTDEDGSTDGSAVDSEVSTASGSAAFLGELDEDDSETVSFDTRIDPDVDVESYLLELTVVYEDEDGILRESSTLATAVEPTGAQSFEIETVESRLEVGESGRITAELENTGPEDVETPVVRAEPASDRLDIGENRAALADLNESESATVSFDTEVSGEADPGPRQVTFTVEYGVDGDRLETDPFVERVDVREDQPAFNITTENAEIPAGTTQTVELTVTNNRAERLSNINVFLYPDGPLSVDADEAFIPALEPGESRTLSVEVSVEETASQRAYPLEVDFRYDDQEDDDRISQVYQVPITAAEPPPDDGLLPSLLSLAGAAVVLIGGVVVLRRRQ